MNDIKGYLKESRAKEIDSNLNNLISALNDEGFSVNFGTIGTRTTYALLQNESTDKEFVGYTFLRDMRFYQEDVGKLKALQQAIARKEIAENK